MATSFFWHGAQYWPNVLYDLWRKSRKNQKGHIEDGAHPASTLCK